VAYASSLVVEELTAAGKGSPRRVTLIGPGLPFMGAEWGGENNLITTWYQGNGDEATQQVLGPRELPSHWNGDWRRTMMGKSPSGFVDEDGFALEVVRPMDLMNALESIFRGGQRLRVTWTVSSTSSNPDEEGRIVREGRAKTWKFKPTRVQDIEWEVEFHWMSRGKKTVKVTSSRANTVVGDTSALTNKLNKLLALGIKQRLGVTSPKSLTLGELEQLASLPSRLVARLARQVQQITSTVTQVVNIAKTLASQPAAIANSIVNQCHNVISQCRNFTDDIGRIPAELHSTQSRVDSMLRAASTFSRQSDAAGEVAKAAFDLAQKLQQQLAATPLSGKVGVQQLTGPGAILAAYVVRQGDTPQRISQRFYGTPDHAIDLLRANRLPYHQPTLPIGKVLIVPDLSTTGPGNPGTTGA